MSYKVYEVSTRNHVHEHQRVVERLNENSLQAAVNLVGRAFKAGKRIMTCGNGRSASTASHYITD